MLIMLASSSFSQQTNPSPTFSKQDYLKKSKNQKTAAWIFLGGGATTLLTGLVIPKGEVVHEGWFGNDYKNDGIKAGLGLTGILSMAGSIPFFVVSSKNKKKAASVSISNEKIQSLQKGSFAYRFVPSVSLIIRL